MNSADKSQIISGIVAAGNFILATVFPSDLESAVQWSVGLVVAAITGWKAPSVVSGAGVSLKDAVNRIESEPESVLGKIIERVHGRTS